MQINYKLLLTAGLIGLSIQACVSNKPTVAPTYDCANITSTTITYTKDIKPIMELSCVSCHNPRQKEHVIDLSTYTGTKEHTKYSHFMGSLHHLKGFDAMPEHAPKLNDEVLKTIQCWISNGCKE